MVKISDINKVTVPAKFPDLLNTRTMATMVINAPIMPIKDVPGIKYTSKNIRKNPSSNKIINQVIIQVIIHETLMM
jgi:hypothetical protein